VQDAPENPHNKNPNRNFNKNVENIFLGKFSVKSWGKSAELL